LSRVSFLIIRVGIALIAVLASAPARALEKCKVKVDAKTGTLQVSASAVTGGLRFGATAGAITDAFFNSATCVGGGKAKQCLLADPASVAAKTPPPGCTLYLADDAASTCSVWIKGCTPGSRVLEPPANCARVVNGVTIFDACP
jgi:hypothetical protein